jgi:putative ABC transport system permease protein
VSGLTRLFRRKRRYDDLSVSIQEHLAETADELMAQGMTRRQAEQAARRAFGNSTLIEQRSREQWQWPALESIWADTKYALRQLLKSPGFTVTAVATLSLGIALNTTMFSMVSEFLLNHAPGSEAGNLVVVSSVSPDGSAQADANPVSVPNYLAWSADTRLFSAMTAGDEDRTGSLSGNGQQPESVSYAAVAPNYFSVFGVTPEIGGPFISGEDQPGRDHVVILSHRLWEHRFSSDRTIVGRTIRLNRENYTVAGVMPDSFRLLGFTPKLWVPLTLAPADRTPDARKNRFLFLFARLAPGVTLARARTEMNVSAQRAQREFAGTEQRWGANVRDISDFLLHDFGIRAAIGVMMTVVVFVLLLACANVAGLLLTRAVGRQKELALRVSLGATRTRVVRQLLTEGLVLALLGGGLGLLLAFFGIRILQAGMRFNEAIADVSVRLDAKVLIYAAVVSLLAAVLSSVAPALKISRAALNTNLKSESRGATSGRGHNRMRVLLVGGEVAVALFLLIGTCLLIRSVYMLDHQDLGFSHDRLFTACAVLDQARYPDASRQSEFVRAALAQLQQIPGVEHAAVASDLPATGAGRVTIHIKGQPPAQPNDQPSAIDVAVTPAYFQTADILLLHGRTFTDADGPTATRVIVVNQEFVHKYFQDADAIGKQVQLDVPGGIPEWCQIAGVVADVKIQSEDPRVSPEIYEAFQQRPSASFGFMLRANVDTNSLAPALRRAIAQVDPELPLLHVMTMNAVIHSQTNGNGLFTRLMSTFAALALLLSAIGIYGLIAYSVSQRTHEIGIRLALGARPSIISRMILREGLTVAAIGCVIGFALALPLPNLFLAIFDSQLPLASPVVFPIVLLSMLMVAFAATLIPALRAMRVDPTAALRIE